MRPLNSGMLVYLSFYLWLTLHLMIFVVVNDDLCKENLQLAGDLLNSFYCHAAIRWLAASWIFQIFSNNLFQIQMKIYKRNLVLWIIDSDGGKNMILYYISELNCLTSFGVCLDKFCYKYFYLLTSLYSLKLTDVFHWFYCHLNPIWRNININKFVVY